jgi:hypothetical protein
MSDPACRNFRELLGVYVVGAIEPNERSMFDAHLNQCYGCREELASLAVLPALLHRIPVAEAEKLAQPGPPGVDQEDPAPEVLSGLLTEVKARRRTNRLRTLLAAAAVVVAAVSGSVATTSALSQPQPSAPVLLEVVHAHRDGVSGVVKYGKSPWGTEIWLRATGIPEWTHCRFWITTAGRHKELVGGWLVGPRAAKMWYPIGADVPKKSITGFVLEAGKVLLHFPAT